MRITMLASLMYIRLTENWSFLLSHWTIHAQYEKIIMRNATRGRGHLPSHPRSEDDSRE